MDSTAVMTQNSSHTYLPSYPVTDLNKALHLGLPCPSKITYDRTDLLAPLNVVSQRPPDDQLQWPRSPSNPSDSIWAASSHHTH